MIRHVISDSSPGLNRKLFDANLLSTIERLQKFVKDSQTAQQEVDAGRHPSSQEDWQRCLDFCQREQSRTRSEFAEFVLQQHGLRAEYQFQRHKPAILALILGIPAICVGGTWSQIAL